MLSELKSTITQTTADLYGQQTEVEVDRPEERFGDYSTNVSLKLAKVLSRSPQEIAEELADKLRSNSLFSDVSVAGAGFINFKLANQALVELAESQPSKSLEGKTVVAEYSDPNPFKVLHAGHVYGSVVGDAIANLLVSAGAKVHRVNFGGDVGRHVAISMWSILGKLDGENPDKLTEVNEADRLQWLTDRYVEGYAAFESDEAVKSSVTELNKRIYKIVNSGDHDSALAKIYWTCRQWSYDSLKQFYEKIGITFERYYPESEVSELGFQTVRQHTPDVYTESDGAIVFKGEDYGLFTNVFINSQGLPTYAAKDVGLLFQKDEDYHYDLSIIITGNEQSGYMEVVLKSVEQYSPDLVSKTKHLTHGMVKLAGGVKMSSRLGNVLTANAVLDATKEANNDHGDDDYVTIGAIKYAFLKQSIGGDIIYDPAESVSLEGNSGPYLQYAYARAMGILDKAGESSFDLKSADNFTDFERSLLRKVGEYSEVIELATSELRPHHVAGYIYDLAQNFNRFYENSRVVGDERQDLRLSLVRLYASKLESGLKLLGIETLNKM